jgi:nitroimidazol reductase NimA-like FMN-containing flavoprotein (pyridoxamine 5'-phosphate oxidase superfamily)
MARETGKRKARKPLQTLRKWRAVTAYIARVVSVVRIACNVDTKPQVVALTYLNDALVF